MGKTTLSRRQRSQSTKGGSKRVKHGTITKIFFGRIAFFTDKKKTAFYKKCIH